MFSVRNVSFYYLEFTLILLFQKFKPTHPIHTANNPTEFVRFGKRGKEYGEA